MSAIHVHDCRRLIEVDGIYLDTLPGAGKLVFPDGTGQVHHPSASKKAPAISHPPYGLCGHNLWPTKLE